MNLAGETLGDFDEGGAGVSRARLFIRHRFCIPILLFSRHASCPPIYERLGGLTHCAGLHISGRRLPRVGRNMRAIRRAKLAQQNWRSTRYLAMIWIKADISSYRR